MMRDQLLRAFEEQEDRERQPVSTEFEAVMRNEDEGFVASCNETLDEIVDAVPGSDGWLEVMAPSGAPHTAEAAENGQMQWRRRTDAEMYHGELQAWFSDKHVDMSSGVHQEVATRLRAWAAKLVDAAGRIERLAVEEGGEA